MMDQDATDSYADGKIKAELGDDPQRTGEYSFGFTLYNLENTDSTFTLSADFFTQAALQGELNNGNGQVMNFCGQKDCRISRGRCLGRGWENAEAGNACGAGRLRL